VIELQDRGALRKFLELYYIGGRAKYKGYLSLSFLTTLSLSKTASIDYNNMQLEYINIYKEGFTLDLFIIWIVHDPYVCRLVRHLLNQRLSVCVECGVATCLRSVVAFFLQLRHKLWVGVALFGQCKA
jgi:hypothetical protein